MLLIVQITALPGLSRKIVARPCGGLRLFRVLGSAGSSRHTANRRGGRSACITRSRRSKGGLVRNLPPSPSRCRPAAGCVSRRQGSGPGWGGSVDVPAAGLTTAPQRTPTPSPGRRHRGSGFAGAAARIRSPSSSVPRSCRWLTAAAWWMPWRMRISSVPHPYRKACPSVALPSRKACPSVAHPSRKAYLSVAVALRSCRTQGHRLEPKDHCIQRMPPSPRWSHYAATLRAMPRCFAIAVGPSSAFSCLICAASLGARDHAGAAAGGHRQGEGRRGGHHAMMVSMSLLVGLRASSRSPPHGQDPQADAALRQIRLDGQQLSAGRLQATLLRRQPGGPG